MQGPLCLGKAQYQTTRPVFVFGIVLNNFGIIIQSLPHFLNRNIPDNALINSMSGKFKLLISQLSQLIFWKGNMRYKYLKIMDIK